MNLLTKILPYLLIGILILLSPWVMAARPQVDLVIINNLFHPAVLKVPANKKLKLVIINHDDEPEEFDSFALNREKVIFGQSKAVIYVGPLSPGEYPFFGQYHPTTAQGMIIAIPANEWEQHHAN
jgi:hypothetical protein